MKQYSFSLRYLSEFNKWLRSFRKIYEQEARTVFVSVFTGWRKAEDVRELLQRLQEELPDVIIAGCTTDGEILGESLAAGTTVLTVMFLEKTEVRLFSVDFDTTSAEDAAESLVRDINSSGAAGVGLLVSKSDENAHRFIPMLKALSPGIKMFGAIAGVVGESEQYIFMKGSMLDNGAIAVTFIGDDIRMRVTSSVGWTPLGPSFLITKMEGDNVLRELDGQQAYYIYRKYLGMERDEIRSNSLLFPLCTQRGGSQIMRLPDYCTEDGALKLSGDFYEGENVRLCYGDPGKILDASYNVRTDIMTFEPEAIMVFPCMSRRIFLQEDAEKELHPIYSIAPNSAGFYVHGEIFRNDNGNVMLLNMSFLAVSFREGPQGEMTERFMPLDPHPKELTAAMRLVKHLVNFVAVTSAESEMATHQLEELAITDRLTGLYNRGETEAVLRKTLLGHRSGDEAISAIMIDLDDFKDVNDRFGHSVGDDVLRWCAKIFRINIRKEDTAGRWGGEEFLIVLPGMPLEEALRKAEQIRKQMEEGRILPDGGTVTASFGVARFPEDGDYRSFCKQLDDALYHAKDGGKNRVFLAESSS